MPDNSFVVMYSKFIAVIGTALDILLIVMAVGVTFSQQMTSIISVIIFYGVFGLSFFGGLYLVLVSVRHKIICKGKEITVVPIAAKPFTFLLSDIVSVVRERKATHYGERERIVIRTNGGRRIIASSIQISYSRFLKTIESNVSGERLIGFGDNRK